MNHAARLALLVPAAFATAGLAAAQSIERLSVSTAGEIANFGTETVTRPSDDGRFIAFTTTATNLVQPDVPGTRDVFLRDRIAGTTVRVRTNGVAGDLAADARTLSYLRTPTAVGAVVDLATDAEFALTTPPILSSPGRFSADGRYALYVRGDAGAGGLREVVRREFATAVDDVVSTTFQGQPNTLLALPGHLSASGRIATFTTADPLIVPGDGNDRPDAFYKDYGFGFTTRYSLDAAGAELPLDSSAGAVTPDTRFFLFTSLAPVVAGDTNGTWDLHVVDRFLGGTRRVSVDSRGAQANGATSDLEAWIAVDGSRVYFDSHAANLVAGDTNGVADVFEHDVSTGATRRLVLGVGGAEPNGSIDLRGVSVDGRYLTILSDATNLVPGPQDGQVHAYLVDLGPQCFVTSYCSALPNSSGQAAAIQWSGTPGFTLNNFVLSAVRLPANAIGTFFHGTQRVDPPAPFGDGLRCAGGTLVRLGTLNAVGDTVIQFQDLAGAGYAGVSPGDVRRFQLLYRDPAAGGAGFNTTAALEVTFCP